MFRQLSDINGRILALSITGEISDEEHGLIDLLLRHYIGQCGRISVLAVIKPYPSLSSAEALYEDLRMVKLHAEHIDKLAVVSTRPLNSTYVGLFGLFGRVRADYFEMDQLETAKQWLAEGQPQEAACESPAL